MNLSHPIFRYAIVLATYALLQYAVASQFRIDRVSVDLLLVLAISAGMQSGVEVGAVIGFGCGLAMDLLTVTPFGLGAISLLAAGVVGAGLERATVHSARWLTMVVAFISATASLVLFAVLGSMMGRNDLVNGHLLIVVLVVSSTSAILVFPTLRACRWADPEESRIRTAAR